MFALGGCCDVKAEWSEEEREREGRQKAERWLASSTMPENMLWMLQNWPDHVEDALRRGLNNAQHLKVTGPAQALRLRADYLHVGQGLSVT